MTSIGYRDGALTSAMSVQCERGVVDVDHEQGVRIGRGGNWEDLGPDGVPDGIVAAVAREQRAFFDGIAGGYSPIPGSYGRHIMAVIDAALRSERERREVDVVS